eukprot:TRINITY_DN5484_c0_g1_i1.p1 TRINITY_DN5484_c0_g1~~TRINITY_DN5484_c0_g1_i1.p1  ORF type:complete len:479 (+),score=138.37 TRINITY_DN5484_c0_g1_i1:138-1574(+)
MSLESSSDEEDNLSAEQTEKLATLQDMTGIEDLSICWALLESKGWDLEATVREHLNIPPLMRDEGPLLDPVGPAPPHRRNGGTLPPSEQPSTSFTLMSYGTSLFLFPFRFAYRVLHFFSSYLLSFFPLEAPTSPGVDVAEFIASFRSEYENRGSEGAYPSTHLPFLSLSYHSALESAKRDLKFLLVYIHSPKHHRIREFVNDTLLSTEFREFLENRSHELLLWGASVESREGYNVSRALRESSYPFLSLVVLRGNRMVSVGRVEGYVEPPALISRLEAIISDNEAYVVAARVDREERNLTQSLREEQDAAFQESLRLDRDREAAKAEERRRVEREEANRLSEIRRLSERKDRIQKLKMDLVSFLPEEPEVGPDPSLVVKLVIKLPQGQRLQRRFRKDHSLLLLYIYVFCHPESPDEFDLTTNFPRKVLDCKPSFIDDIVEDGRELGEMEASEALKGLPTFESAGLEGNTMLFVNDLEA